MYVFHPLFFFVLIFAISLIFCANLMFVNLMHPDFSRTPSPVPNILYLAWDTPNGKPSLLVPLVFRPGLLVKVSSVEQFCWFSLLWNEFWNVFDYWEALGQWLHYPTKTRSILSRRCKFVWYIPSAFRLNLVTKQPDHQTFEQAIAHIIHIVYRSVLSSAASDPRRRFNAWKFGVCVFVFQYSTHIVVWVCKVIFIWKAKFHLCNFICYVIRRDWRTQRCHASGMARCGKDMKRRPGIHRPHPNHHPDAHVLKRSITVYLQRCIMRYRLMPWHPDPVIGTFLICFIVCDYLNVFQQMKYFEQKARRPEGPKLNPAFAPRKSLFLTSRATSSFGRRFSWCRQHCIFNF